MTIINMQTKSIQDIYLSSLFFYYQDNEQHYDCDCILVSLNDIYVQIHLFKTKHMLEEKVACFVKQYSYTMFQTYFHICNHGNCFIKSNQIKVYETIKLCDITDDTFINNKSFNSFIALMYMKDITFDTIRIFIERNDMNIKYTNVNNFYQLIESINDTFDSNIIISILQILDEYKYQLLTIAVISSPYAVKYMDEQPEELCLISVRNAPYALEHINIKTYDVCLEAVSRDGETLIYVPVEHQTEELCMIALKQNITSIQYIINNNEDLIMYALKEYPMTLIYINDDILNDRICEYAVSLDYRNLRFISNKYKTVDLCMMAFYKNIDAFEYFPESLKTYNLCLNVVSKNGLLLEFISEPTSEICEIAIENDPGAIEFIPDYIWKLWDDHKITLKINDTETIVTKSYVMCIEAIKLNPSLIQYIKNPSLKCGSLS